MKVAHFSVLAALFLLPTTGVSFAFPAIDILGTCQEIGPMNHCQNPHGTAYCPAERPEEGRTRYGCDCEHGTKKVVLFKQGGLRESGGDVLIAGSTLVGCIHKYDADAP